MSYYIIYTNNIMLYNSVFAKNVKTLCRSLFMTSHTMGAVKIVLYPKMYVTH